MQLLLIALGGAAGGIARFWLSGVVTRRFGETFPWGTFAVNVSGAFGIGLLSAAPIAGTMMGLSARELWMLFAIGVFGSYTTVSSFSLQTLALARRGQWRGAALNVGLSLALCLTAVIAGHMIGRSAIG